MWFAIACLFSFCLMEGGAWLAHKYLMHGPLWSWHEDHHKPNGNLFQKNDRFFLIFAVPSWLSIMFGMIYQFHFLTGFGAGIAVYGLVYFLVHDVLIHRRFNWFDKTENNYFSAMRKAHKAHHNNQFKQGGICFGMLLVPRKYFHV